MIGASAPNIRRVLNNLTTLGPLIKDSRDAQHSVYRLNLESKKIAALIFLAYALADPQWIKNDILLKDGDVSSEQNETITIDLKQIYSFDPKDISLDLSGTHYLFKSCLYSSYS